MKLRLIFIALILVISLMLISACDSDEILLDDNEKEQEEVQKEQKEKDGDQQKESDEEKDIGEGLDIEFDITSHAMQDLEGNEIEVPNDLEDRILLKFWETTCPICIEELPEVEQVYQEVSDRDDIGIYTVNYMEDREDIQSFMEDEGYDFPVLFDSDGTVAEDYSVMGFPVTYVVNQDLEVLSFQAGPIGAEEMITELEEAE